MRTFITTWPLMIQHMHTNHLLTPSHSYRQLATMYLHITRRYPCYIVHIKHLPLIQQAPGHDSGLAGTYDGRVSDGVRLQVLISCKSIRRKNRTSALQVSIIVKECMQMRHAAWQMRESMIDSLAGWDISLGTIENKYSW